ncbi:MAG: hypothetical protein LBL94_03610 [Prevotellaceae bacterium]|jgi:hypothetical protein|nr:hypothetical protein [Prevotellaceae bacterium]
MFIYERKRKCPAIALAAFALLACSSWQAAAQRQSAGAQSKHHFFAWVGGGYSRLDLHLNDIAAQGGLGGNLGAGYGYALSAHWAISTGLEFALVGSSTKPVTPATERKLRDTEGATLTMRYTFNRYQERQQAHYLNIPLSVEYAHGMFYGGVGAKVGLLLSATAVTAASPVVTAGEYDDYIGSFEDMPDHFFTKNDTRATNPLSLATNIMVCAEAGVNLTRIRQKLPLRAALFCDYGISNLQKSAGKELVEYGDNPLNVTLNSIAANASTRITSLMAGLKLTLFLKAATPKRDYPCNCGK